MTIYYVRKDGNDTTGDGSTGTPWLTVAKALATVTTGGHTVRIGAGTYAEDNGSGLLTVAWNASALGITLESESGNVDDVIIQGASNATYNILCQGNSRYVTWNNITFGCRVATNSSAIRLTAAHHYTFTGCKFQRPNSGAAAAAVLLIPSGATDSINTVTFTDCTATGVAAGRGWLIDRLTVGRTVDTITLTNCVCNSTTSSTPLSVKMATNVTITGGTYVGDTYGILFGVDGTGETVNATGTISGVTIASNNHTLMVGNGTENVTVTGCQITAGIYGIVVKECAGATVTGNSINITRSDLANPRGILFKAATGATVTGNTIRNSANVSTNTGMLMVSAGDTGNKSGTITCTGNNVYAGPGFLYNIGDDAADSGGCVFNSNRYQVKGGGWGVIRGTSVTSLYAARAAWDTYGDGTNDDNSTLIGSDDAAFIILMRGRR